MALFKKLRERKVSKIVENVYKRNRFKRYIMLVLGCLIVAGAFNLFFLKYNIAKLLAILERIFAY